VLKHPRPVDRALLDWGRLTTTSTRLHAYDLLVVCCMCNNRACVRLACDSARRARMGPEMIGGFRCCAPLVIQGAEKVCAPMDSRGEICEGPVVLLKGRQYHAVSLLSRLVLTFYVCLSSAELHAFPAQTLA
jgi:hypothetical protein